MTIYKTVDMSKQMQAIRSKYGERVFGNEKAMLEIASLWGCASNESGVCLQRTKERIVKVGQCEGAFSYCQTEKGYFLKGISMMSSFSGRSYAPSVWTSIGYPSYDDARLASVVEMIDFFDGVVSDKSGCNSNSNRSNAREVLAILESEKTPQLLLF